MGLFRFLFSDNDEILREVKSNCEVLKQDNEALKARLNRVEACVKSLPSIDGIKNVVDRSLDQATQIISGNVKKSANHLEQKRLEDVNAGREIIKRLEERLSSVVKNESSRRASLIEAIDKSVSQLKAPLESMQRDLESKNLDGLGEEFVKAVEEIASGVNEHYEAVVEKVLDKVFEEYKRDFHEFRTELINTVRKELSSDKEEKPQTQQRSRQTAKKPRRT